MAGVRISLRPLLKQVGLQYRACGRVAASTQASADPQSLRHMDVKPFEDIPGPKGIFLWPVIGPLFHFKPFTTFTPETCHQLYDSLFDTYGPIVKINLGREMILISEPADLITVYQNEGKNPFRPSLELGVLYAERNGFKNNLEDLQGAEWAKLRTPLNKRFGKINSTSHYLQPQNAVADELVQILANEKMEAKEMEDLFFRYSSESIGVVCFNARLGLLNIKQENSETKEFLESSKELFISLHKALTGKSIGHKWYKNKTYRDYDRCKKILRKNCMTYLTKAKDKVESSKRDGTLDPEEPNLLLSLSTDNTLCSQDIVNTMMTLYTAGTDSTAKNIQSMLYNLAQNPEKQENLRKEVLNILGQDQPMTDEALSKMPYLKACLKESLRLIYPTSSGTLRKLPTDVILSGYKVPAGTFIGLHNPKTCRDHFKDPDKFIPERWLRTKDGHQAEDFPKVASLPFGHGARNCIGRRFAEQEMYLCIAKVLQKLKIDIAEESRNTNFTYSIFVQPEKSINFVFTKV